MQVRLQGLTSGTPGVPLASYPSDRSGTDGCDDTGEGNEGVDGMSSFLDPAENAFVTRPFYVRYNDHTACLCELAHFRMELDSSVSAREMEDVLVRFDLQFAVRPSAADGEQAIDSPPKPEDYSVISTHDFQLRGALWLGAHHAVPLSFEEHAVCWTGATIHAVLSDVRPRPDLTLPMSPKSEDPVKSSGPASAQGAYISGILGLLAPKHDDTVTLARADDLGERLLAPLIGSFVALRAALASMQAQVEDCPSLHLPDSLDVEPLRYRTSQLPALKQRKKLAVPTTIHTQTEAEGAAAKLWREIIKGEMGGGDAGAAVDAHLSATKVADAIGAAAQGVAAQIFQLWHALLMLCQARPHDLCVVMESRLRDAERRRWELGVLRAKPAPLAALVEPAKAQIDVEQTAKATALRDSAPYREAEGWAGTHIGANLYDMCLPASRPNTQHVFFEESYQPPNFKGGQTLGAASEHLGEGSVFVFCHGFQGNQYDLRYFRNRVGIRYPKARLLCCSSIEDNTHAAIGEQGKLVAEEVSRYIAGMDDPDSVQRISFVGHSLGTLVIREALGSNIMKPYVDRLCTFISLGGTHLGYTFGNNSLLTSAMWVYQRWTKSASLRQLNIKDCASPQQGFVASLAQKPALEKFKHVVLVASGQDRYAPFFSARIQVAPTANERSQIGSASIAMVGALMKPLIMSHTTKVTRLGVCFGGSAGAFLDSAIGRAAHIQFLEDHALIHMIVGCGYVN